MVAATSWKAQARRKESHQPGVEEQLSSNLYWGAVKEYLGGLPGVLIRLCAIPKGQASLIQLFSMFSLSFHLQMPLQLA